MNNLPVFFILRKDQRLMPRPGLLCSEPHFHRDGWL